MTLTLNEALTLTTRRALELYRIGTLVIQGDAYRDDVVDVISHIAVVIDETFDAVNDNLWIENEKGQRIVII